MLAHVLLWAAAWLAVGASECLPGLGSHPEIEAHTCALFNARRWQTEPTRRPEDAALQARIPWDRPKPETFLIVGVVSAPGNFEQRQVLGTCRSACTAH